MTTINDNQNNDSGPIVMIAGSPSTPSRSARLLDHLDTLLAQAGYATDRFNVRDLPAEALLHADFEDPSLRGAQQRVAQARAIVLATPVYKASYSGVLKAFLDLLPQDVLAGKAALALITGGNLQHRILADFAVRQLFTDLSAGHVLPTIFTLDVQIAWSVENGLKLDLEVKRRLEDRVQQLHQWLNPVVQASATQPEVRRTSHRLSEVSSN